MYIHVFVCVCVCVCVCMHVILNVNTHGTYVRIYDGQFLHFFSCLLYLTMPFLDNIQGIWYFNLMHYYDMCVIVGIPKSVYPLHVHMK